MINIDSCRDFNRNDFELEEFAIFAVCVAGKRADVCAKKVNSLCQDIRLYDDLTPFRYLSAWATRPDLIAECLRYYRIGQYERISRVLSRLCSVDLRRAALEELEQITGPKTARFFLMNTRPNQRLAALDTHILAELREHYPNLCKNRTTPPAGLHYQALEQLWLMHCEKLHRDPAEYDLEVWVRRSNAKRS